MKSAPFDYHRASSVTDAIEVLQACEGDGKLIAGGQSLVPLLAMRLAQPTVLIDLNGVPDLSTTGELSSDGTAVRFGAMTRHAELMRQSLHPLGADMAGWIGHTAIRTRGTIGGSLAHADPNAECPALALACDAVVRTQTPAGERSIAVNDFLDGMLQTAIADDEVLTSVDLLLPRRWGFAELARRSGDFALVLACVTELPDGWRVVIGGIDSTPIRVLEAEQALASGAGPAEVGRVVQTSVTAYDDLHAGTSYRIAMAGELTRRAAEQAHTPSTDSDRSGQ